MSLFPRLRAPRIQGLWVLCACVAIAGCVSSSSPPQPAPIRNPNSRPAANSVSPATELLIGDVASGSVSKLTWDKLATDKPIGIHNGGQVSVEVHTDTAVTDVVVSGDALTPTALRRVRAGSWRGTFEYWDLSNDLNSTSSISVELLSAKGPIDKSISVKTIHDS